VEAIGLTIVFICAFFTFAWVCALYNYMATLLGATPSQSTWNAGDVGAHALHVVVVATAGRHFNRGPHDLFALGYLGWVARPSMLTVSTMAMVIVLWRGQCVSDSLRAFASEAAGSPKL
jgi:uncharacterized membrane protein